MQEQGTCSKSRSQAQQILVSKGFPSCVLLGYLPQTAPGPSPVPEPGSSLVPRGRLVSLIGHCHFAIFLCVFSSASISVHKCWKLHALLSPQALPLRTHPSSPTGDTNKCKVSGCRVWGWGWRHQECTQRVSGKVLNSPAAHPDPLCCVPLPSAGPCPSSRQPCHPCHPRRLLLCSCFVVKTPRSFFLKLILSKNLSLYSDSWASLGFPGIFCLVSLPSSSKPLSWVCLSPTPPGRGTCCRAVALFLPVAPHPSPWLCLQGYCCLCLLSCLPSSFLSHCGGWVREGGRTAGCLERRSLTPSPCFHDLPSL